MKIKRENQCKMLSPVPGMWKSTVSISWLSCPLLLAIHLSIKTAQETQHKLSQTRTISEFGYYPLSSEMVQVWLSGHCNWMPVIGSKPQIPEKQPIRVCYYSQESIWPMSVQYKWWEETFFQCSMWARKHVTSAVAGSHLVTKREAGLRRKLRYKAGQNQGNDREAELRPWLHHCWDPSFL